MLHSRLATFFAKRTGTHSEDWYPLWQARYGFLAIGQALSDVSTIKSQATDRLDDPPTVLTQAFTCATAVQPFLAAGLHVQLAPVDPGTLSLPYPQVVQQYAKQTGQKPAAVVVQRTFGLIPPGKTPSQGRGEETSQGRGQETSQGPNPPSLLFIEDCAHSLARLGPVLADVSVHSFGFEKTLPTTRFGAAVWVNPGLKNKSPLLDAAIRHRLSATTSLPRRQQLIARAYPVQAAILRTLPEKLANYLQEHAEKTGIMVDPLRSIPEPIETPGTTTTSTTTSTTSNNSRNPASPVYAMPRWLEKQLLTALNDLDAVEVQRAIISEKYRTALASTHEPVTHELSIHEPGIHESSIHEPGTHEPSTHSAPRVPEAFLENAAQPYVCFPVLVDNPDQLIAEIRRRGGNARDWYRTPLYGWADRVAERPPEQSADQAATGQTNSAHPKPQDTTGQNYLYQHIVGLPTYIPEQLAEEIIDLLQH